MTVSIASAPGKILWIGGYSVLEKSNVSFVTGVDKRVFARVKKLDENKIVINAPQFNASIEATFELNKLVFKNPLTPEQDSATKFVRGVVETCFNYFIRKNIAFNGIELTTFSDPAFGVGATKTGLGASAAVTVAATAAVFAVHGIDPLKDKELLHKTAQLIHCVVQGKIGSGFDVAAATYGGHAYSRYSPNILKKRDFLETLEGVWDYSSKPLAMPSSFVTVVGNIAGESASTGEMVKKINAWKAANPQEYADLMRNLNDANAEAITFLEKINALARQNPARYAKIIALVDAKQVSSELLNEIELFTHFKQAFERGRELTRELGEKSGAPIEPPVLSKLIDESRKHGAFVSKLPGAGGGDSIAAICLSEESAKKMREFWRGYKAKKIEPLDLSVSNEGVRLELESAFIALV